MKTKVLIAIVLLGLMAVATSCEIDGGTSISLSGQTVIDAYSEYGEFLVKNVDSGDFVFIKDGGGLDSIRAKSGQEISVSFVPKEEYKNTAFTSTYTFFDDIEVHDSLDYKLKIENLEIGKYNVKLWVKPKDVDVAIKEPATLVVDVIL